MGCCATRSKAPCSILHRSIGQRHLSGINTRSSFLFILQNKVSVRYNVLGCNFVVAEPQHTYRRQATVSAPGDMPLYLYLIPVDFYTYDLDRAAKSSHRYLDIGLVRLTPPTTGKPLTRVMSGTVYRFIVLSKRRRKA